MTSKRNTAVGRLEEPTGRPSQEIDSIADAQSPIVKLSNKTDRYLNLKLSGQSKVTFISFMRNQRSR